MIRLVEHEVANPFELDGAALDMVEQAPRRRHDEIGRGLRSASNCGPILTPPISSAVLQMVALAEDVEEVLRLHRDLARRAQDRGRGRPEPC